MFKIANKVRKEIEMRTLYSEKILLALLYFSDLSRYESRHIRSQIVKFILYVGLLMLNGDILLQYVVHLKSKTLSMTDFELCFTIDMRRNVVISLMPLYSVCQKSKITPQALVYSEIFFLILIL